MGYGSYQGLCGGLGSNALLQQQAPSSFNQCNQWNVSTITTSTVPFVLTNAPSTSPAVREGDEIAWLKRRVSEVCWKP